MKFLNLNSGYTFALENLEKKARLVVYNNGVENVCHKSTLKSLVQFIQSGDNHLFRGRLQFHKDEVGINIMVKGNIVGEISLPKFTNYLQKAQQ
ncbi:hypothetical protein KXD93_09810 [Mucilaginibacter sp. BJC16-A38]|uniref:hypothetical protein n=1 Tax=Mucilaginibacter phenanthrenivorans TaxID=1234842 RepID=UPI00215841D6|nr:hypothetical protein [Mucilaginibacter phenanthrenivorans]MCR8557938.1 hypothetical protein [Mucilaginibacter phenanthrenivorans]